MLQRLQATRKQDHKKGNGSGQVEGIHGAKRFSGHPLLELQQNLGNRTVVHLVGSDRFRAEAGNDGSKDRMEQTPGPTKASRIGSTRLLNIPGTIISGQRLVGLHASPKTATGRRSQLPQLMQAAQRKPSISSAEPPLVQFDISGTRPCRQPPSHIRTMDDYIALVERAEAAYPGVTTRNMITRIRRTKYSGFPWTSFVGAPSSESALTARGSLTDADIQAFACDIVISMPGGGSTDPSHVLVGLDVRRYPGGSMLAPQGVSAEAATTWAGDVGSAYSEYIAQNHPSAEASSDLQTRENYWNEFSPYHDLMADIDGLAMSAGQPRQWSFDENQPLSVNLRNFFEPAAGQGRHRRFTLFAGIAGIQWTGRGSSLAITDASRRNVIERQIDLFARGNLPTLPQIMLHQQQSGSIAGILYWRTYTQRTRNWSWFIDRFVNFVQDGLRGENP